MMSWVALDRAIRLLGKNEVWKRERDRIASEVYTRGRNTWKNCLLQVFDRPAVDAALLLTPMTGFPIHEHILRNTVEVVEDELRYGDFVFRYRTEDGLEGHEGAFPICSFWLVDALLHVGRYVGAKSLFERLLAHANNVGLYSEEIDPTTHELLGNFPQAYTHLALIGSAAHLQLYEKHGAQGLKGGYADLAKRTVSATLGWRALWAVFKATWRVGRIISSKKSVLECRTY